MTYWGPKYEHAKVSNAESPVYSLPDFDFNCAGWSDIGGHKALHASNGDGANDTSGKCGNGACYLENSGSDGQDTNASEPGVCVDDDLYEDELSVY